LGLWQTCGHDVNSTWCVHVVMVHSFQSLVWSDNLCWLIFGWSVVLLLYIDVSMIHYSISVVASNWWIIIRKSWTHSLQMSLTLFALSFFQHFLQFDCKVQSQLHKDDFLVFNCKKLIYSINVRNKRDAVHCTWRFGV
jgi:hypothetical protein